MVDVMITVRLKTCIPGSYFGVDLSNVVFAFKN